MKAPLIRECFANFECRLHDDSLVETYNFFIFKVVKAHVARVVAHPLPFVLDEKEKAILAEIRKAYNYYQHMEQQASQAQVIPDWLVDKFAIAGTSKECRAQVERLKDSGIKQIAIVPYGTRGGDRADTLREFAAAVF